MRASFAQRKQCTPRVFCAAAHAAAARAASQRDSLKATREAEQLVAHERDERGHNNGDAVWNVRCAALASAPPREKRWKLVAEGLSGSSGSDDERPRASEDAPDCPLLKRPKLRRGNLRG